MNFTSCVSSQAEIHIPGKVNYAAPCTKAMCADEIVFTQRGVRGGTGVISPERIAGCFYKSITINPGSCSRRAPLIDQARSSASGCRHREWFRAFLIQTKNFRKIMSDRTLSASLRVITLNLWGQQGNWEARRSVLIDGLRNRNPDLVAFQEARKTETDDQTVDLLGP